MEIFYGNIMEFYGNIVRGSFCALDLRLWMDLRLLMQKALKHFEGEARY